MAQVTFTNLTGEILLLQELYRSIDPGESFTIERYRDDLHSMPAIRNLWYQNKLQIIVASDPGEDAFIEMVDPHGDMGLVMQPTAGSPAYTINNINAVPETFLRVNADNGPISIYLPSISLFPDSKITIKNESDSDYLVSMHGNGADTVDAVSVYSVSGRFGIQLRNNGISDWMIY